MTTPSTPSSGLSPTPAFSLTAQNADRLAIPRNSLVELKILDGDGIYDYLILAREGAKKTLVFGQSALPRRNGIPMPIYHRWTWFDSFPDCNCIVVNDPTLYQSENILCGWFQGKAENCALDVSARHIRAIIETIKSKESCTYFYGSSAGGFYSLQMASRLKGSTAIAEIPQIIMKSYHVPSAVTAIMETCYSGMSAEVVFEQFSERLSVLDRFKAVGDIPKIVYVQNLDDKIHCERHMRPFQEFLAQSPVEWQGKVFFRYYSKKTEQGDGHVAAPRSFAVDSVKAAMRIFLPV